MKALKKVISTALLPANNGSPITCPDRVSWDTPHTDMSFPPVYCAVIIRPGEIIFHVPACRKSLVQEGQPSHLPVLHLAPYFLGGSAVHFLWCANVTTTPTFKHFTRLRQSSDHHHLLAPMLDWLLSTQLPHSTPVIH